MHKTLAVCAHRTSLGWSVCAPKWAPHRRHPPIFLVTLWRGSNAARAAESRSDHSCSIARNRCTRPGWQHAFACVGEIDRRSEVALFELLPVKKKQSRDGCSTILVVTRVRMNRPAQNRSVDIAPAMQFELAEVNLTASNSPPLKLAEVVSEGFLQTVSFT
jgi:hypothetical protein